MSLRGLRTAAMDDEDEADHGWYRRHLRNLREESWWYSVRTREDMFEYRALSRRRRVRSIPRPRSGSRDSDIASAADAERLQVLDAVGRAKALKLCLRRIWAVASSLPDRENSLPGLIPVPGTFSIPGHDRERHEHEQCTFDFCEQSRVDFTSVAQHHETPCRGKCEHIIFPLELLNERIINRKPTAWRVDEPSLLDASRPYMAVSHVWSDGTGSGIWGPGKVNKCLYTFFSSIARSFQCEGCWWDSISIPLDDETRTKALSSMHINYSNSRITLVHDLYLREWEWVDSETACFAIVMSPWYSRGWTALELAQSHKVKILFKAKNNNYVIKDLDVDILAEVPENHATADAIRKLRRASVDEFGTLLAILGARDTSKPRDVPIISGLLAGVDVSGGLSQQEIYQRILRKLGKIAQGHLFHNSATMSAPGFSWCPTNILDMPMAETDSAMLTLHENGDLEGDWKVQEIDSVKVENLITRGTHPLTQVSLESAFRGENTKKHVLLLETREPKATSHDRRALLVKLMERESSDEILATFVGPVYFRAPTDSAERNDMKQLQIKVRIGSTEGLNDVPGRAWDYVKSKMSEKASTTEDTPATGLGQPTTIFDAPLNLDDASHRASPDWRAILFTEGFLKHTLLKDENRISSTSNNKSRSPDDMAMFFYLDDDQELKDPPRAFFYGHEGMVDSVKVWLGKNPDFAKGQAKVLAVGNDNTIKTDLRSKEQDANQLLVGAFFHVAESNNEGTDIEALVTLLLDISAPYDCDTPGRMPLHVALEHRNYRFVETLLKNEPSPTRVDAKIGDKKQTALHLAAKDRKMPPTIYDTLVQKSHDVDARDEPLLRTALHYAAETKNKDMVKTLLKGGAALYVQDSKSRVALHYAASKGFADIVELLLERAQTPPSVTDSEEAINTGNVPSDHNDTSTRDDTNGVTGHASVEEPGNENDDKVDEPNANMDGTSSTDISHPELDRRESSFYADIVDNQGQTPLHLAAEAGHDLVVANLLTAGANPCAMTKKEETALTLAAQRGHMEIVKSLLKPQVGDFQQTELNRALLMAAVENKEKIIRELDRNGARSEGSMRSGGMTALHWTIQAKNVASAELLTQSQEDAEINVVDATRKQSALLMASEKGLTSVVKLLLKKKADIKLTDSNKRTALHLATSGSFVETVSLLFNEGYGPLVNDQDNKNRTALHWAAVEGSTDITELIVNNKGHHNIDDEDGRTALDIASEKGLSEVVKILLEGGSDPTHGKDGRSALERAAIYGHRAVVEELLPRIKSPAIKERAIQLAAKSGFLSVAMLIHKTINEATTKASTLRTILIAAAANPGDDAIDELLNHRTDSSIQDLTDVNIQDEKGRSLLMLAIENRHQRLANYLVSPRLKTNFPDKDNKTALMVAAIENDADMVENLYYYDAIPDLVDNKGYTALHYAVENGCFGSFMMLLRLPSTGLLTVQDRQKRTVLHVALEKFRQWSPSMPVESRSRRPSDKEVYLDICVELIRRDVPLEVRDKNGRNALHLAVAQNLEQIAGFLLVSSRSTQSMDTEDMEGQTPLLLAAARGYTFLVVLMLSHSFKPDTKDKNGQTPLLLTAEKGDDRSVIALLTRGADPNLQDKHGRTALSQAAQNGHRNVVHSLLEWRGDHEISLNTRDNMGRTALILAAENGHAGIVKTLVGKLANADVVGYDGKKAWQKAVDKGHASVVESLLSNKDAPIQDRQAVNEALLLASRRGWADLVKVLLEQDVDLTFQSSGDKWTALHMAAMSGHREVLRMLIRKGVDIVIKDRNGHTALFQATEQGFESIVKLLLKREEIKNDIHAWMGKESLLFAAEKGYDGIVKRLLDSGVDRNATDASDRTAMALAAANGKERIVKMLLGRGASWAIKDRDERTALHHAAWGGHHNIVEILLAYEPPVIEVVQNSHVPASNVVVTDLTAVDSSVVDIGGQSALHLAAERASVEAVEGLLKKRANVNAKCKDGQTVLHRAAWGGSSEVVRLLRKSGADPFIRDNQDKKPWHIAAEKGHETIAVELLGEEESVYDERIQGQKGLIFAAKMGHTSIARCLLQKHAEATVKDEDGRTPLHWAAARGDKELVKLLICHCDVSINAVDHARRTALCLAVLYDRTAVVEILLDRGLDANVRDAQGQTALHHAAQRGNEEISQVLVHHNADPHIHDNDRRKAWQLAAEEGHHQVVRLLLKKEIDLGQHNQRREELFLKMSQRNMVPMVQLLLDKNVDKNVKDRFGRTAIGLAAENGADDVLRLLLYEGANLNDADLRGQTPLLWAAKAGNAKVIGLLLDKITSHPGSSEMDSSETDSSEVEPSEGDPSEGDASEAVFDEMTAIVDHQDAEERTALVIAIENKHDKVVRLLLDKCRGAINVNLADKMQRTALQLAAEMGNNIWVQLLLRSNAEQQHRDSLGRTALLLAAEQGHTEVVKALLESAKREHVNLADNQGRTALHAATDRGNQAMVAALLSEGADPCALDKRKRSSLLLAVEHGDKAVVELLLQNEATQDADKDGRTPLLLAIANGDKAIVEALLDHANDDPNATSDKAFVKALVNHSDADPDTNDTPNQRSLLHLAVESGNKDVAWLVLKMITSRNDVEHGGG